MATNTMPGVERPAKGARQTWSPSTLAARTQCVIIAPLDMSDCRLGQRPQRSAPIAKRHEEQRTRPIRHLPIATSTTARWILAAIVALIILLFAGVPAAARYMN